MDKAEGAKIYLERLFRISFPCAATFQRIAHVPLVVKVGPADNLLLLLLTVGLLAMYTIVP